MARRKLKLKIWHWILIALIFVVVFNFQEYKAAYEARTAQYQEQSRGFALTLLTAGFILVILFTVTGSLLLNKYLLYIIIGLVMVGMMKAMMGGMGKPKDPWD